MSSSLLTAILATGKIKQYQTIVIITTIWVFILTYFAFNIGLPPETTYIIHICIYAILVIIRIMYAKKLIGLNPISFIKDVVIRCLSVLCLVFIVPIIIAETMEPGLSRLLISVPTTVISSIFIACQLWYVLEKKNIGKPAKKKWYEEEDEPKKLKQKILKK